MTAAKIALTRKQFNVAREAMRAKLRKEYAKRSADHDDWIQDALMTLPAIANETEKELRSRAALAVVTPARDAVRTSKRRKEALARKLPGVEVTTASIDEDAPEGAKERLQNLVRSLEPPETRTLSLEIKDLRQVEAAEFEPENIIGGVMALGTRARLSSKRNGRANRRVRAIAAVLTALGDGDAEVDAELERVARRHLGPHRGPERKAEQTRRFIFAVNYARTSGDIVGALNMLRSSPDLLGPVGIPPLGEPWPGESRAIEAVSKAIGDADLAAAQIDVARAVYRVLGAPPQAVAALNQSERARASRARKKKPKSV